METHNAHGYTFKDGIVIPPAPAPTHSVGHFDPDTSEPQHAFDHHVTHGNYAHVMETLILPKNANFQYEPGMYVYVHSSAFPTDAMDALECCIDDVAGAPLEIVVTPCNHPELTRTVSQDKLSAPIWV